MLFMRRGFRRACAALCALGLADVVLGFAQIYSIVKAPIEQDLNNDLTKDLLGDLDTVFLISYAVGMFFMGYIADRSNIRVFLGLCMIGSGIGCAACGLT